ncbi:HlyD family secretion protein [Sporomusa sp.]|uniref:HlyD family secretion protein n=1 Tax=Sporomusa sp. TaxID=2078658 RepID=UPI002C3209FC|nr:HlyD family secretion protein [Sporomusa sp.]HWR42659.1 HlyD family secretion protein [Sporomusa sp.]
MSREKTINKKKLIGIAGLVVAIIVCGGLWWWIKYAGVVSTDDARVKGTIVAVSSRVSAQIDEIMVNEGDEVQAGQVIAKLDSKELEAQVAQARANLTAAQAKLAGIKAGNRPQQVAQAEAGAEQAAANLENAQKMYERSDTLYKEGAISAQQLDSARTALSVAQAQYHAAGQSLSLTAEGARPEDIQAAAAQVEQAAAVLKNAELQLNNTVIKAPIAGVVAVKSVDAGESVSVGQALVNIANLNDIWVAANIDETNVGKMRVGQNVEFSIDAYPGKTFNGEVSEIGAATGSQFALLPTENTSGNYTKVTQKLPIKIKVTTNASYTLKPGMSAIVTVHVS